MFPRALTCVVLAFACTAIAVHAAAADCVLTWYAGRAGKTLLYTTYSSPATTLLVGLEGETAKRVDHARGSLEALAGSGSRAWNVRRDASSPATLHVFELSAEGAETASGSLNLAATANRFSWATDRNGTPWLFVETVDGGRRVTAYRSTPTGWVSEGVVPETLQTPRLERFSGRLLMRGWQFAAAKPPVRLVESLPEGMTAADPIEWFGWRRQTIVAVERKGIFTTSDDGRTWQALRREPFVGYVATDDGTLAIAASDGDDVVLQAWRGTWSELARVSRREYDQASSFVSVGSKIIALHVCLRELTRNDVIERNVYSAAGRCTKLVTVRRIPSR